MSTFRKLEIPIRGMDCAECTQHVQRAIARLPGVETVDVFLASEKAVVRLDPERIDLPMIRQAVADAGYAAPLQDEQPPIQSETGTADVRRWSAFQPDFTQRVGVLLALVFAAILFVIIIGEWLGLFEWLNAAVPFVVGIGLVLLAGYPIFRNVLRAAWRRQILAHTLMSLGVLAALAVGQWVTALLVVFFMRVGDFVESYTTERARRAVKDLNALAPQTARVERAGAEIEIPIAQVQVSETVVVRPGEQIPVDGEVLTGHATVNQAALTGEAMPVQVTTGSRVFAATIAQLGSLRVRVTGIGADTTFGRVIQLVQEAEGQRAEVQRFADKFSAYFMPLVAIIAALTFLISRDPLSTAAVLVVACSCAIALATPVAMLASIGAAAKRGLLIKGGKYLETLARADVLLLDKTGTLTLGRPQLTDIVALDGIGQEELLALAAAVEKDSEHPLATTVREAAVTRALSVPTAREFTALPGKGVRATVEGKIVAVGSARWLRGEASAHALRVSELEGQGKTLLYVSVENKVAGVLAAADTLRPEVPAALNELRALSVKTIELLTGDNERATSALAQPLGIPFRANLLPQDKIRIVQEYQAQGRVVVMVGDGVNDAPALAQANIGMAMGAAGSDIAIEAAHIALLRDDWALVPDAFRIARRTMNVVKMNLGFSALYNLVGLSLAAFGFLPPVLAAAAQSLPDLGIMANSSRLLRQK